MEQQLAVSIARMEEQMKRLLADNEDARISRKENYLTLQNMEKRLIAVENHVTNAQPTLAEFVILKHKVAGAGVLGKWLWAVGGFLIGSVAMVAGFGRAIKTWFIG